MNDYRIGSGFDVHRFSQDRGRDLILAGVVIDCPFSLEAVSDGDLVLHAVCDAFCGACGLGDIGDLFPPEEKSSKGLSSLVIAEEVREKTEKKFTAVNIDLTIIAEQPRLVRYKAAMTESLKKIFACSEVNVKIKSKEGLDILGGKDAIACMAVVLLKKKIN